MVVKLDYVATFCIHDYLAVFRLAEVAFRIEDEQRWGSLALAPVTALSSHQEKGIGAQLIATAHRRTTSLGFTSVVLLSHENCYSKSAINPPNELPSEHSSSFLR